jgi:hypothetical protein
MRVHLDDLALLNTDPVADPVLRYGFTNYGKSPAPMLEACWEKYVGLKLPDRPAYKNIGPLFGMLIIPAEQDVDPPGHKWSHIFGEYLTQQVFDPIRKKQARLYIYGYIRYEDVFECRYRVGFAYWIDPKGNAHVVTPEQAPLYVYRHEEQKAKNADLSEPE